MITAIAQHEPVHLVVTGPQMEAGVRQNLTNTTAENVTFHTSWDYDSSWMRDNGPVYVEEGGELTAQNWEFDAWGGGFGPPSEVPFAADNGIPGLVATYLVQKTHIFRPILY
jgi:agmatine/peptidylarginine deiminase